ncbi:MAG: hypothetical protein C5B43_02520 [Verrucomicrobia bacterium]|nr:MAG: hypothetical protein C5B43_02520 [Verrucomicrobiota bacterium]
MDLSVIIRFLLFCSYLFIFSLNLNSVIFAANEDSNLGNQDFLDIIIDTTHAYAYLNYTDTADRRYSIYSSLMPKSEAGKKNLEGIDRFPIILECLLSDDKGSFSLNEISERLSLRELISAYLFGIYYLLSKFMNTMDIGEIVTDRPLRDQIKIQRRFYLTKEQLKKAKSIINNSFVESSKGNILYDAIKYNCVDYVKDVYDAIGLDKTYGEFLSQFENNYTFFEIKKRHVPYTILKIYEAHNEGMIGPLKVAKGIWKGIQMLKFSS